MAPSESKPLCWSSLPVELLEEILYRIPVGSLVRFKPLCKQWYALLNDKRFIYKHLTLSQEQEFIRVYDKSTQLFNLETQALSCLQGPSDIYTMIHCDGLLLCETKSNLRKQLALWNPNLNRVKWIKPSRFYTRRDVYGFGYDNVSRDNYKILRFVTKNKFVEIYEFKSKLWRSLDYAALGCPSVQLFCVKSNSVSLKGNMYWIAYRSTEDTNFFIQSFDFSTETFKHICSLPFEYGLTTLQQKVVLSCFGGDRLSLVHQQNHVKTVEVWVSNKVTDTVVLWSKFFNVTSPDVPLVFYSRYKSSYLTYYIDENKSIMLWCGIVKQYDGERYVLTTVYEMGEGMIKKEVDTTLQSIKLLDSRFHHCCINYVPSLVPVPE